MTRIGSSNHPASLGGDETFSGVRKIKGQQVRGKKCDWGGGKGKGGSQNRKKLPIKNIKKFHVMGRDKSGGEREKGDATLPQKKKKKKKPQKQKKSGRRGY